MDRVRADVEDSEAHASRVQATRAGRVREWPRDNMSGMSADHAPAVSPALSLYREIGRAEWSRLAAGMAQPLSETEVVQIRGLGDRLSIAEVAEVYLPLSRLLSLYAEDTKRLGAQTSAFLGEADSTTPFVVGVAGSVAVGKS